MRGPVLRNSIKEVVTKDKDGEMKKFTECHKQIRETVPVSMYWYVGRQDKTNRIVLIMGLGLTNLHGSSHSSEGRRGGG